MQETGQALALALCMLVASCSPRFEGTVVPPGSFVELPGTYRVLTGTQALRISTEDGRLNWRLEDLEEGGSIGPSDPFIDPSSPWFVFAEAPGRWWIFDGERELFLASVEGPGVTLYSLGAMGQSLREQIPPEMAERLPKGL